MGRPVNPLNQEDQPRWFLLAMASRWPLAIVLATWSAALAATQILGQPIPIAVKRQMPFPVVLKGPIQVENILTPVQVQANGSLPVAVRAPTALPVRANESLPVDVARIQKPVAVEKIVEAVEIVSEEPLQVNGEVGVNQIGGNVTVSIKDALKSISPLPLPPLP